MNIEDRYRTKETEHLTVGILFNHPVKPSRGEGIDYIAEAEVEEEAEAVREALEKLGIKYQMISFEMDIGLLIKFLKRYKPDVVINLCEGAFGDSSQEMNVPAVLELLKIPYTGSPPLTLGLCQNKELSKKILKANRLPTPDFTVLRKPDEWNNEIKFPLFVKPLREDGSLGISKKSYVQNNTELKAQVKYITTIYKQPALVEEYIAGRELNIAILGNKPPMVLPISEIIFKSENEPKIVCYSSKWIKESDEYKKTNPVCPTSLKPSVKDKIEKIAIEAYNALHCRDYARIDIRLRKNLPFILEVNPNPDVSPDAGFSRSLLAAGILYEEFVEKIIQLAIQRCEAKNSWFNSRSF